MLPLVLAVPAKPVFHPPGLLTPHGRHYTARQLILMGASTGGTEALKAVLTSLPADVPGILIVQHIPAQFSLAFANRDYLKKEYGNFTSTPRDVFKQALDISAYSLLALTRAAVPLMPTGGSIIVFGQQRDMLDVVENFLEFFNCSIKYSYCYLVSFYF